MIKRLSALLAALGVMVVSAPAAAAYEPVNIVHTERVQVGPYGLTVGFSTWPVRAMQSLDFTFVPDDGIAGKTGTLQQRYRGAPQVENTGRGRTAPLARHPRKRDVWGLDIRSLNRPGEWSLKFSIDGPAGRGEGELTGLQVLDQPGPPLALSWSVSALPLLGLVGFLALAWRRTSPNRYELVAL
ncbi:hypothetical protein [Allokutzneria albata]|uniref:Uncharacterized protein n=1 Tax=Allokutzneria albata TaxID=211114 RepID=A0A1G9RZ53_ALLAB|nr:hypothetical protein [Allokutzneria albata]SDM27765.1 hypothetical protein SAMN04489726_0747 [Allokutzneria albata]